MNRVQLIREKLKRDGYVEHRDGTWHRPDAPPDTRSKRRSPAPSVVKTGERKRN